MKKSLVFALVISLILSGCMGNTPKAVKGIENLPSTDESVRLLTPFDGVGTSVGVQTQEGFYELANFSENNRNIVYTDHATKSRIYLCNRPECQHLNESCPSWIENVSGGAFLGVDGEKIYVIVLGAPDNSESPAEKCGRIIQMDLDGSNRKVVKIFEPTQSIMGGISSDGTNLYFILQEFTKSTKTYKKYLTALTIETGELLFLKDYPDGASIWIEGCEGRNLLLYENRKGPPSDKTGEEGWQENRDNARQVYSKFSLETGEEQELMQFPLAERLGILKSNIMYYIDCTDASIKIQNLYDQTIKTVQQNLKFTGFDHTNEMAVWDDHYVYETAELLEDGTLITEPYAVDLTSGEYLHPLLSCSSEYWSAKSIVRILAEFEDSFLVRSGMGSVHKNYYYLDGHSEIAEMVYPEYAFIAKEDYWNGVANYIPISDQVFG